MNKRPRIPAIAVLLFVLTAGLLFLGFATKRNLPSDDQLAALRAQVAKPDASPTTWLHYADALHHAGQFIRCAAAYQRYLEIDPYNRQARLQCASALALVGKSDPFFAFMQSTLLVDPKLTLNILGRPEAAPFLNEPRFQTLQRDAVAGSMD